jgi:NADH-quinone oxidoreductase subunit L
MPAETHTSSLEILYLLTLLLPLLSFIISIFTSERYAWLVSPLATLLLMASAITSAIVLSIQWNEPIHIIRHHWFSISSGNFSANISLSNQSALMLFVVSVISFLVHLFSLGYMAADTHVKRYFAMLGFFTFSMQGIVLSDNLLLIFVFWELVGFSSYLLIGHYMQKPEAAKASTKAFIMNRIGDAGFLVGIMMVWAHTNTLNISEIVTPGAVFQWQTAASLCIFCGIIGKSAQFPLFTWLPDAMEGPTPVSALIHAATMVTAGVYLLARIYNFFTPVSLIIVALTGAITALIGALAALSQYDIKKILAYSTVSQLGLMMMALGMGNVNAALLHLFTHAFFKACLFLSAGSVIYALHQAQQQSHEHYDVQDLRNLGGLRKKMPLTFITFIVSGASLAGIPFFSGFLSKEAILTAVWSHNNALSWLIFTIILAVSFLTVLYTFRLIWSLFMGTARNAETGVTESPLVMRIPLVVLAAGSLWFAVSFNPFDFSGWLFRTDDHSLGLTLLSTTWVLTALISAYFIFRTNNSRVSNIFLHALYVDQVYNAVVKKTIPVITGITAFIDTNIIDRILHAIAFVHVTLAHIIGWIDRVGVDGTVHAAAKLVSGAGSLTRSLQGGKIQLYVFWAAFTIIIFLIWSLN